MQRRRVVDPVTEITDNVARFLERENDALLLDRLDLGKDIGFARTSGQGLRAHLANLGSGKNARFPQAHLARDVFGDARVVPGDDLKCDAELL